MNYQFTTLPNRVRVITVPMQERNSSGVAIWVRAGARFETKKISGVSHFLEHMLFKGTKKRNTRQIKQEIEGVGGMLNAFTGEESTCYYSKLMATHFSEALDVLSDMVNHATMIPEEFNKEKPVILEEIKMYRDLPSHHVHDLMGELLWPDQPLGWPIAGTLETASGISRPEMVKYKNSFYQPQNIIVTVSGPVRHDKVLDQVKKAFTQKSTGPVSKFTKAVTKQTKPKTFFLEKQTEQTHFVIGLHGFSRFHPDRYKLGIMNVILGSNMSSRLFEEVREKRGLAYEIRSGLSFYQDTGAVSISAGVDARKAPMAMEIILRELSRISRQGVSEDELRRAKDYFMSQLHMALEDTLEHLLWVGERVLDRGDLPDTKNIQKSIEAVTRHDVQEAAKQVFKTQHLNLALIGPVAEKMQTLIKNNFEIPGC